MLINDKKLNHIRVETAGGRYLGLVQGFELDTDTGIIEKYYVKSKKLVAGLFENASFPPLWFRQKHESLH